MNGDPMIGLAEAAHFLRMPYQDCHRLLLTGALRGEKRKGRWYVLLVDVKALLDRVDRRIVAATTG